MTDERLKIWIDLLKWSVVSVGLVIMTKIIDAGFKDREVGINEIKEYDKYVSLVTDNSKISERRLLAQYFSHVTPSDKLKKGWNSYYKTVDKEYQKLKNRKDSIEQTLLLMNSSDSTSLNNTNVEILKKEIENLEDELTPNFNNTKSKNYELALKWERIGFDALLNKDLTEAIIAFEKSETNYNSFHQVYEISRYLSDIKRNHNFENDLNWKIIYKTILEDYSWKMPEKVKTKFNDLTR